MDRRRPDMNVNVKLLREIMQYHFGVLETVLYLNTHPDDREVLDLHNEYAIELMKLHKEYQEEYGLLMAGHPTADYPWCWINEPWPWQISY